MIPSFKPLLLALIIVVMVVGVSAYLYNQHTIDIKTKLDHQSKYPYSCVVPDEIWDSCTTRERDNSNRWIAWSFADNQTCFQVYYAVTNWENHQIFTTDSDGITHYKNDRYGSEWGICS